MQRKRVQGASAGYASPSSAERADHRADVPPASEAGSRPRQTRVSRESAESSDSQRVKRLAAIAGVSLAVALMAAVYGAWTALSSQTALEALSADTYPTVVALADIRAGDVLDTSLLEVRSVPRSLRVSGAFDADALGAQGQVVGKRALVDIPAGSQVTPVVVAGSEASDYLAASLAQGMQAVTVAVDVESGMSGQLRPSDRVRVVALEGAASGDALLSTVAEDVRVVALDGSRYGSDGAYVSVTLEVTPAQADAVRSAQYLGKVSLILTAALDRVAGESSGEGAPENAAANKQEALDG